jgi:predicted nucleotidyltransferase component of viral defense system
MYLHEDREIFREVLISTSEALGISLPIVEKDYYVTQILACMVQEQPTCVFKGGTSLSKCYHVIDRFSEDIDISFCEKLSDRKRKALKNETIRGISRTLNMPILDWAEARSRRDFNCYTFSYEMLNSWDNEHKLRVGVKMEVALSTSSFPVNHLQVDSYMYRFLSKDNMGIVDEYQLHPFGMQVQGLERTLIDKVFALCDYYLQGKTKRYSRHIYDIYMLMPHVSMDEKFRKLVEEVRAVRMTLKNCPAASADVCIPLLLNEIIEKEFFRSDYREITVYFQMNPVPYEVAIESLREVIESETFMGNG